MYLEDVESFCQVLFVLSGIVRYSEGSKKHVDDPVPNGDFPVLVSYYWYLVSCQKVND